MKQRMRLFWRRVTNGGGRLLAAVMVAVLICSCAGGADGSAGRAGVVIDLGDGRVLMQTVELPSDGLSGRDLLAATDLALVEKNGFICRIGDVGCDLADCPCLGAYWSYWHWHDGVWSYAVTGASGYRVSAGDIDAWRWNADDAEPDAVDATLLTDSRRLTPGLPRATATDEGLALQVDFEGDVNNNATVAAVCISPGGDEQRLLLARDTGAYTRILSGATSTGTWQVRYIYEDPDGINGSASWPLLIERP